MLSNDTTATHKAIFDGLLAELARMARLVDEAVEAEREECAVLAERADWSGATTEARRVIAAAIRARGGAA